MRPSNRPAFLRSTTYSTATRITQPRNVLFIRAVWWCFLAYELLLVGIIITTMLAPGYTPGRFLISLAALNVSPQSRTFASVLTGFTGSLVYVGFSALLMWRSRSERSAILFSFMFLPFVASNYATPPGLFPPLVMSINGSLFAIALYVWIFLYPTGRFINRWALLAFVYAVASTLVGSLAPSLLSLPALNLVLAVGFFYARYRRSVNIERQQIKWLLLMFIFVFTVAPLYFAGPLFADPFLAALWQVPTAFLFALLVTLWPFAIGFAILRYGLWQVDFLLNRSLVYGALTVVLGLIFAGILALTTAITQGQNSLFGTVLGAVIITALFNPSLKFIQHQVDIRIFRLRFDLNEFNAAQRSPEIKNRGALTGKILDDYRVLDVIGKGGMGEVYRAFYYQDEVALKVLPIDLAQQALYRTRFEREIEALSRLEHPNIVQIIGSGMVDGTYYLAMEYIKGTDLSSYIKAHGPLSLDEFRQVIVDVAGALEAAHAAGFVHRDLKPSNIMLRRLPNQKHWQAILVDFGVVKLSDTQGALTNSGAVGSIDYMSPEQISTAKDVTLAADIYALGVVAYEALTGQRVFTGNVGQILFAHLQQPPPDPRIHVAELPPAIAAGIQRALAKKPEDRYARASDFAQVFAEFTA